MMKLILVSVFILMSSFSWSQTILSLSSLEQDINLNPYIGAYIDKTGKLSFQDVQNLPASAFVDIDTSGLRTNVTKDVIWLKLEIQSSFETDREAVIDFVDPSLDEVKLYVINNQGITTEYSGTATPPENKSIATNRNSLLLALPRLGYVQCYIKVRSPNSMTISAKLLDDNQALVKNMKERTLLGLFYGAMMVFLLYNLLLFATTRLRVFFVYALFIVFVSLFTGAADGFTPFYLNFLVQWTNGYQDIITATLLNTLGLIFMLEFLTIKTVANSFYRIVIAFIVLCFAGIAFVFFIDPSIAYSMLSLIGMITLLLYIIGGIIGVMRKVPQAGFYLLAYIIFGIFIFIFILNLFRLIEYTLIVQYSIHLGYLISIIILSGGLSVRIYQFYKQYLKREREQKVLIEQKNEELEIKVAERTRDISIKEANLRAILNNTDSAIWLVDDQNKLIDYNNAFEKSTKLMYGASIEKGQSILDITDDKAEIEKWSARYKEALAGEKNMFVDEYNFNGRKFNYEIFSYPIRDEGKVRGVAIFSKDVTIRTSARKQLKRQNKMLEKVNKELDSFVYSASHDLKAPLSSIKGLIGLVKIEQDIANRQIYYDMMEKSIRGLDQFINDIIDYSRNSRVSKAPEIVNFDEVIHQVFNDLKFMTDNRNINKKIIVKQDVNFKTDLTRIRVILRNLISNAIKYGCDKPGKEVIEITCIVESKKTVIEVRDYGHGIEEVHEKKIFNMFYRAHETATGTGLGLYIVKETVEKLEGTIEFISHYNDGASFVVEIPNSR